MPHLLINKSVFRGACGSKHYFYAHQKMAQTLTIISVRSIQKLLTNVSILTIFERSILKKIILAKLNKRNRIINIEIHYDFIGILNKKVSRCVLLT